MALVPVPNTKNPPEGKEMDEERNKALAHILDKMQNHPAKVVREKLEQFDQIMHNPSRLSELKTFLPQTMELIENYDEAKIFTGMGGMEYLSQILDMHDQDLQKSACDFISELVQNHVDCQNSTKTLNILHKLISIIKSSNSHDDTKIKALYALSSLLRGNETLQDQFINTEDGLSFLLNCLQSTTSKIRIKATLLTLYMAMENSQFKSQLDCKPLLERLIHNFIDLEHDISHEHIINAMVTIVKANPDSISHIKSKFPNFKTFLLQRAALLSGRPEFTEEENYIKTLYEMMYETNLDKTVESLHLDKSFK